METKRILIVGGGSGIGAALVDRLLRQGLSVAATARDPATIAPRPGLTVQRFDASASEGELEVPETLDGVVYAPGTITLKPFHRLTREDFAREMEVNFFGAVRVLQQALPALKPAPGGSASVVLFSSVAATTGMPFHASIGSAKAAVEGLIRSLAAEWAPRIRVNGIAPSLTNTPLAAGLLGSGEKVEAAAKRHPLQRLGDPADVAEAVAFLLGEGSRFMTGQILAMDGGLSSVRQF